MFEISMRLTNLIGALFFLIIGGYFSYTNYESQHYLMLSVTAVSGVVFAGTCLIFAFRK